MWHLQDILPHCQKIQSYLKRRSEDVFEAYDKPNTHINSWDAYHFTTLLASCGLNYKTVYCAYYATSTVRSFWFAIILENEFNI